jgi:hypothetical protein
MGNGLLGMDDSGGFTAATDPRVCFTEKRSVVEQTFGWLN